MGRALSPTMTVRQFENGYWYLDQLKDFAERIGIPAAKKLRKDELEKAVVVFLRTGRATLPTKRALRKTGVKDVQRGLQLKLRIEHYTSNRATKDFIVEQARVMEPDVREKSGVWYRLNRWREEQITSGAQPTYGDLVRQYIVLNWMPRFERVRHSRYYINFVADFLDANKSATRAEAIAAWKQLKRLDVPKDYASWVNVRAKRDKKRNILAVGVVLMLIAASAVAQPRREPPDESTLNPDRPHIEILLDDFHDRIDALRLAFYESPRLTGAPVMELTAAGLFLRGTLVCTWPGGPLDLTNGRQELMVLGYADAHATDYRGCPPGLPIRSVVGDADGPYARLLIEVAALRGTLVEARRGRTRWYFDLNALPGDPVDRGGRIQTRLRRLVRLKGFGAWVWHESARDIERRAAALQAAVLEDGTFTTFLRGIRACLSSSSAPGCLVPFVAASPSAVLGSAGEDLADHATADQFVEFMWRQPKDRDGFNEKRPWEYMVECLSSGAPDWVHANLNAVRFAINDWYCDVRRLEDGWKLVEFLARP